MNKKKMIAFLCVFALLFAGCGKTESGENPAVTEGTEQTVFAPDAERIGQTVLVPDAEGQLGADGSSGTEVKGSVTDNAGATDKEMPSQTSTPGQIPALTAPQAPTATPEPMATPIPTATPLPTTTPLPTATPEPTTTPVPTRAPLPTLAPTPTPRPDVTPIPGKYNQRQIGDDVWCRVYENGVMHIVGSGSTWDYESFVEAYKKLSMLEGYRLRGKTVIVEEGITRIGDFGLAYMQSATKIILPSTLKELGECAFYGSGDYDGCEWIGLTPEKWKTQGNSLLGGRDMDKVPEYAPYCQVFVPAADPENPKLRHTMQMGDNVWLEFWDNDYLYVKGSGKMWNKSDIFCLYSTYQNEQGVLREICDTITHVVVEEGITYIGNQNFLGIGKVEEVWLPSTLKQIAREQVGVCFQTGIEPKIMHCYHEGEPITIEVLYKYGRDMCKPFKILDWIKYPEKYWDSLEWYEKDDLEEYRIIPEES